MKVDIITPDSKVFSGDVASVMLPGANGSFQILNNHANLISSLEKGIVTTISDGGEKKEMNISGGVVEVLKNEVIVLVESILD